MRLAESQGGPVHVHSVVLADDEVADALQAEALLHHLAGWHVECPPGGGWVVCSKGGTTRRIWAVPFDPMEEVVRA